MAVQKLLFNRLTFYKFETNAIDFGTSKWNFVVERSSQLRIYPTILEIIIYLFIFFDSCIRQKREKMLVGKNEITRNNKEDVEINFQTLVFK